MPAPKLYIGAKEISALMGISLREAQYTLKAFELRGQTVRFGRIQRVALKTFAQFLSAQDGTSAADTLQELKQAIRA